MNKQSFHIGTILSITHGLLIAPNLVEDIYKILNFMTGDNLSTVALPRCGEEVKPYLFEQLPFLHEIDQEKHEMFVRSFFKGNIGNGLSDDERLNRVLDHYARLYGEYHDLFPMHQEDHENIDPISEFKRYRPDLSDENIISISPEDDDIDPIGNIDWKIK